MTRIIDCFLFFNDFDMLDIRLNSLAPHVDRFVLCESATAFNGDDKPLYFADNKERYAHFPITHLIADDGQLYGARVDRNGLFSRAIYQREYLWHGLDGLADDDIVLISDADEIPNLEAYNGRSEGAFCQRMYCYYCNVFTGQERWKGTVAIKRGNMTVPIHEIACSKNRRGTSAVRHNGGWHFTSTGTEEQFLHKLDCSCHCGDDPTTYRDQALRNRRDLRDPYHMVWISRRRRRRYTVEMPSGPQWLLDNADRYPHLWYTPS